MPEARTVRCPRCQHEMNYYEEQLRGPLVCLSCGARVLDPTTSGPRPPDPGRPDPPRAANETFAVRDDEPTRPDRVKPTRARRTRYDYDDEEDDPGRRRRPRERADGSNLWVWILGVVLLGFVCMAALSYF